MSRGLLALLLRRRESLGSWRRVIGAAIGVMLLVAAVWAVASRGPVVEEAWAATREAPWWIIAAALALPVVSWLLTAMAFWVLSRRFAPVPLSDMTALIGAAWLLNHLPLRPGMVGRVAFHKKYHGMTIRECVRVMAVAMVCTGISLGLLLGAAAVVSQTRSVAAAVAALVGPTALIGAAALVAKAAGWGWWAEAAALALRGLDMLAWLARYAIAFALVGHEVSLERLVIVTAVCQVAMLVPLTGNGVGLREWAVGITVAAVASEDAASQAVAIGLAADLVNRAAETVLAVPVGLACSALLAKRMRAIPPPERDPVATSSA